MRNKIVIMLLIFFVISINVISQEIFQQTSIEFNHVFNDEESYICQATSTIELQPGFSYEPEMNNNMVLEIDRYTVFPPDKEMIGGIYGDDEGVVGSIPASFNISNTGAAVYSVDIQLPSALGNMKPNLSLVYNNQSADGLLGWSWDLVGLSSIERVGQTEYHDGKVTNVDFINDRYALDGQRLMSIGGNVYKTEIDNMDKIVSFTGNKRGPDYFIVWKNDGTIWEYGTMTDSKIEPQGINNVVLKWLVSKITDRDGNSIVYNYYENNNTGETYIKSIEYSSNDKANVKPAYKVIFQYDEKTSDVRRNYVYGNVVSNSKILSDIVVYNNNSGKKIIEYSLKYDKPGYYGNNYFLHYRLNSILLTSGEDKLNPTRILWNTNKKHYPNGTDDYKIYELNRSVFNKVPFVGDFNGDGFSDVLMLPYKIQDTYLESVEGEVYLNNGNGSFQNDPLTKIRFNKNLDWIYVVDLNGDGIDDIVPYEVDYKDNVKNVRFAIFLMDKGSFINKGTFQYDGDIVLLPGNFVEKDSYGLFVVNINIANANKNTADYISYKNGVFVKKYINNSKNIIGNDINNIAVDMSGDGICEILSLSDDGYKVFRLKDVGEYNLELFAEGTSMTNKIYPFPNDYNGDGKVDLLYYDPSKYWNIVLSKGNTYSKPMFCSNNNLLRTIVLNPKDRYCCSLKEMQEPTVTIRTADFDGDGVSDVGVFKNYAGNHYLEIGFSPCEKSETEYAFSYQKRYYMPINYSHQTIQLGRFLPQENISILSGLPRKPYGTEKANITSLYPNSAYYSVERIIDGMGNTRGFSYDYLIQNKNDLYSCNGDVTYNDIKRKSVPILALKTDTIYNVNGKPIVTRYKYHNALVHKKGHGFLGFEKIEVRNYVDKILVQKQIQEFELSTMGVNSISLPYSVKVYQGEDHLLNERYYDYKKYYCVSNDKIVSPVLMQEQEVVYDFDKKNEPLKNIITQNTYESDVMTKFAYNMLVQLKTTKKGYDENITITDSHKCQYCEETSLFYCDDLDDWIINRPKKIIKSVCDRSDGKIGHVQLYEYDKNIPTRIVMEKKIPNLSMDMTDSLLLVNCYKYDMVGNVVEHKMSSPSLSESKILKYEYGTEYQYRYKTKSIDELGRELTCVYDDDFGIVESTKDYNGFNTLLEKNPLGVKDVMTMPDGMKQMKLLCWSANNKYAPEGAAYYSWEKSTGKSESMRFFHKSGVELRNVTFDIDGKAVFVDKTYDDYGNLKHETLPYCEHQNRMYVSKVYDRYNRVVETNYPDGTKKSYTYAGNVVYMEQTSNDAAKRYRKEEYNVMGWIVSVVDNGGNEIKYEYYGDGMLKSSQIGENKNSRVVVTYDNCRKKSSLYDPNTGLISYKNDVLGNVKQIADSQNIIEFEYDVSGRMINRVEKDLRRNKRTSVQWVYDCGVGGNGLLSKIITSHIHQVYYDYDDKLRLVNKTEMINGVKYKTTYTYDAANRISTITYPSGVCVSKKYSNSGYEKMICNAKTDDLLWMTTKMNADGYITEFKYGNGLKTEYVYNPCTSLIENIKTTKGNDIVQNLVYEYDGVGNLKSRCDMKYYNCEEFEYDCYDRLTRIVLNGKETGRMMYDDLGNICEKEIYGIKVLYNAVYDKDKPNAIVNANSDDEKIYDRHKQNIKYSSFDGIIGIEGDNKSIVIDYGYDYDRIYMRTRVGNSVKGKTYVDNCEFVEENDKKMVLTYLEGPMGVFAVCVNDDKESINYVNKDNLDSWNVITDDDGNLLQVLSFDAWGNLRDSSNWNESNVDDVILYDRGFTGHEHLVDFGLINMNGRMYDPMMSMMLSPDNNIQMPQYSQNFNRYSYCLNNPLKYSDPTGEFVESLVYGVVGGCANLVMNARNIDSFGEGAMLFGVGFLKGFLAEYTMGQSWLLQVGVNTLMDGLVSGVNRMVNVGSGDFVFSGDDWNSIKTAAHYGLGNGLVKNFMYNYSVEPTDTQYGESWFEMSYHREISHGVISSVAHGMGCWFSGQPFLTTMRFKDVGFDLKMLGLIAKRLVSSYVYKTGFAHMAVDHRAQEIKESILKDITKEIPDYPDFDYEYEVLGLFVEDFRFYVVGNVYEKLPGEMVEIYQKPYLEEVITFPFSYSLFKALFFDCRE